MIRTAAFLFGFFRLNLKAQEIKIKKKRRRKVGLLAVSQCSRAVN